MKRARVDISGHHATYSVPEGLVSHAMDVECVVTVWPGRVCARVMHRKPRATSLVCHAISVCPATLARRASRSVLVALPTCVMDTECARMECLDPVSVPAMPRKRPVSGAEQPVRCVHRATTAVNASHRVLESRSRMGFHRDRRVTVKERVQMVSPAMARVRVRRIMPERRVRLRAQGSVGWCATVKERVPPGRLEMASVHAMRTQRTGSGPVMPVNRV